MHTETLIEDLHDDINTQPSDDVATDVTTPTYLYNLIAQEALRDGISVDTLVSWWIESDSNANQLATQKYRNRPGYMTDGTHWLKVEDFDRRFDDGEEFLDYFTSDDTYDPLMVPQSIRVQISRTANAFIESKAVELGVSKVDLLEDQIDSYCNPLIEELLERHPELRG